MLIHGMQVHEGALCVCVCVLWEQLQSLGQFFLETINRHILTPLFEGLSDY